MKLMVPAGVGTTAPVTTGGIETVVPQARDTAQLTVAVSVWLAPRATEPPCAVTTVAVGCPVILNGVAPLTLGVKFAVLVGVKLALSEWDPPAKMYGHD